MLIKYKHVGTNGRTYISIRDKRVCLYCTKEFYVFPSEQDKFCTRDCFESYAVTEGTKLLRTHTRHSKSTRRKMSKAWTSERRAKHSKHMRCGSVQQDIMQAKGNARRIGIPRPEVTEWFASLTPAQREARSENLSKKLAARYGTQVKTFSRGKQGWVVNRLGEFRYDSTWEKAFLSTISDLDYVTNIRRDYPIKYHDYDGKKRRFLVDFRVERSNRRPVLVEIKCPYFLDTPNTKAKVCAAKQYAKNHGMKFALLASLEEARRGDCI